MGNSAYPAKCRIGISDGIACLACLYLVATPLITREIIRRFFSRRPEHLHPAVAQYLDAPYPEDEDHWRSVGYSVVDIETSGLNHKRDSVLAIGLIDIDEGRIQMNRRWYTMVQPPDEDLVGVESIRIHGLFRKELSESPPPEEVLVELARRLTERVLVVHFCSIDVQFLSRAFQKYFHVKLRGPVLDTARIASFLSHHERLISSFYDNGEEDMSLRGLAKKANLPVYAEHHALNDALTTAQLFLAQATRLEQLGRETFLKLFRVGGCLS